MPGPVELFVVFVFLVVASVLAIALAVKWAMGGGPRDATNDISTASDSGARRILDERYARGEVGREEYLQMRLDIEG